MTFFDCIQQRSTFSNLFEEYFYLDGLSGKLGFRRLKQISQPSTGLKQLEVIAEKKGCTPKQIVLTTIKIVSYCTLIIPLIMLIGKAIQRLIHNPKHDCKEISYTPLSSEAIHQAEQLIEKIYNEYYPQANFVYNERDRVSGDKFLYLRSDSKPARHSRIHPDSGKNSLVKNFTHDPDVLFLTNESGNELSVDNVKEVTSYLETMLTAAFNAGKKVVVARLANRGHCYLAAFDHRGKLKIIDSFSYNAFNVKSLESSLNAAKMQTKEGVPITFKGEKICTAIQKGGHMCVRFATLFAYQILKDKDIDAYKKVVGAFSRKQLKAFSDIHTIDQAPPLANGKNISRDDYVPFMRSWGTHICLGIDDWKQFSLRKLAKGDIIGIHHDRTPAGLKGSKKRPPVYFIQEPGGRQLPFDHYSRTLSESETKLGNIIPRNNELINYVYCSPQDDTLSIAEIPTNCTLMRVFHDIDCTLCKGPSGSTVIHKFYDEACKVCEEQVVEEVFNSWG